MVFGLCANRVIGFGIAFVKDVAATRVSVSHASSGEKLSAVPGFEEVRTEEEKSR
jgi:stage V sporulation protein SpoVS